MEVLVLCRHDGEIEFNASESSPEKKSSASASALKLEGDGNV